MFVEIDSADLHAQLQNAFGLPSLNEGAEEELFGPYPLNSQNVFWRYTRADDAWDVLASDDDAELSFIGSVGDGNSYDKLLEAFDVFRTLPRPGLCSTPNEVTYGQTFVFNGWRFAWLWVPELGRWEIAERGIG